MKTILFVIGSLMFVGTSFGSVVDKASVKHNVQSFKYNKETKTVDVLVDTACYHKEFELAFTKICDKSWPGVCKAYLIETKSVPGAHNGLCRARFVSIVKTKLEDVPAFLRGKIIKIENSVKPVDLDMRSFDPNEGPETVEEENHCK